MKPFFLILASFTTICFGTSAQLMRMAIMPQATVKVTPSIQPVLAGLGIDYYLMEPNGGAGSNQPAYDQVLSPADVVVKINNKLSHKTFQNLVEGANALLLLHPLSKDRIHAEINPLNPESQGIESIELDVLSPVEIGYNKTDADVQQATIIFKNYGQQLTPAEYFDRAICLDIMKQNNKLVFTETLDLSPSSAALCNKLYASLDFSLFPLNDVKTYISRGFISINDSGTLTSESIVQLQQLFYYRKSIATTQAINTGWKTKSYNDCKDAFYLESYHLYKFDDLGTLDTIINNDRYVHMLAWKAKGFAQPSASKPFIVKRNDSVFYQSSPVFFNNAFFMVQAAEMNGFLRSDRISELTLQEARLRLMQLLGLPPGSANDEFEDFWVRKSDMFRPGIDSSLNVGGVLNNLDSVYIKSFLGYSSGSFSSPGLLSKFPFTGLGYTWDWRPENKSHVGLNEFVLKENRMIYLGKTYTTEEYLKKIQ
jgi:hypothetical protein